MRPTGDELLRGVQRALMTYILPELQSEFARTELLLAHRLLDIAAEAWDSAVQRLVDENAFLRDVFRRAALAMGEAPREDMIAFAGELLALARSTDPSLRFSDLADANRTLREMLVRLLPVLEANPTPSFRQLRAEITDWLRQDAEARSLALLGPRADG
jgi:hypothetical protein